jgi:hypothetical protein
MPAMDVSSCCNSSKLQLHVQFIFGFLPVFKWTVFDIGNASCLFSYNFVFRDDSLLVRSVL